MWAIQDTIKGVNEGSYFGREFIFDRKVKQGEKGGFVRFGRVDSEHGDEGADGVAELAAAAT